MVDGTGNTSALAAHITNEASKQTYITIRTLVDRKRMPDAFRTYAYFRWVDDAIDHDAFDPGDRLDFLRRQQELLTRCLQGDFPRQVCTEEQMLVDLLQGDMSHDWGLRIYLQDMMAVMAFDGGRRGRFISQEELAWYSRRLATAVTEAVYTFVGVDCGAPRIPARYVAAYAAHITHMLRDYLEDLDAGYINIPIEVLERDGFEAGDIASDGFRTWVRERVRLARAYFAEGEAYTREMADLRCRIASTCYALRFEGVLQAIERDGYLLRENYDDCKNLTSALNMLWQGLRLAAADIGPKTQGVARPAP
jgi:phytoene/squalene synthetase